MRSLLVVMALTGSATAAPAITSTTRIAATQAAKGEITGKTTLVRQTRLADGGALQLHRSEDSQLQIAMRDRSGAWMAWRKQDGLHAAEEVESVVVSRGKDIVWFHLRVRYDVRRHDVVIGCKPGKQLRCAAVDTTRDWTTSAFISGTTVTTRYSVDGRLHVVTNKLAL
ncbi:MAG: hypothetical protein ABI867_27550 [Kofleriaceae bacterium]